MDRGAWRARVHGVTKSRTRLRDFHFLVVLQAAAHHRRIHCHFNWPVSLLSLHGLLVSLED